MIIVIGAFLSYLMGSIPTAYIFGKLSKGLDIREHGSGNVGATNVFRVLGKGPGAIVLILDILKGLLAVVLIADVLGLTEIYHRLLLSICVISGHNWTIFLKFKGGKGIATTLGVLIGLAIKIASIWPVLAITLIVWVVSFLITAIVSLSSILAAITLPVIMALTSQPLEIIFVGVLLCIFVVIRHRPNVKRLLRGEEPRVPLSFLGKK